MQSTVNGLKTEESRRTELEEEDGEKKKGETEEVEMR